MNSTKVSAVRARAIPGSLKELQRFLGFANFYRQFIWGYSSASESGFLHFKDSVHPSSDSAGPRT